MLLKSRFQESIAFLTCVMLSGASALWADPVVSNVWARQRTDGSHKVDVYYDLRGGEEPMRVNVVFSSDGGVTWDVHPSVEALSESNNVGLGIRNVGPGIQNGAGKHIVWDSGEDFPGIRWSQSGVKVLASEYGDTETITLPGGVPMTLVRIPKGTFTMGSPSTEQGRFSDEGPQHQVTLTHDFYMGKYEVTKAQWTAVMGTTPWVEHCCVLNEPDSPAVVVSWNDINGVGGFMEKLNAHLVGSMGQPYRLPTEAEWEYACRANTTTRFYWGDDPNYTEINDYAWWDGNAEWVGEEYAHIVGTKLPNAFGLYDMSGNAWEWCQDWHGLYVSGSQTDPTGPSSGSHRVLRGGGWGRPGGYCRSASRVAYPPGYGSHHSFGFRLVRTQP